MKYTITEVVDTVAWSEGVANAPGELVKAAKEMAERGEIATFAKTADTSANPAKWVLLTVNPSNQLEVARRA